MRALLALAALAALPAAAQPVRAPAPKALAYRLPTEAPLGSAAPRWPPPDRPPLPADSLRPPDAWLGRDKALHVGASFLLTLSGQYVLTDKADLSNARALPFSVGAALGLGVAKEVADSRRAVGPHFSLRDLAADVLGVAVGVLVTRL